MNAIDKPEKAREIFKQHLPLMYIIIWNLLKKANIPIKRFDPGEGIIDFDYKDGFTHRWNFTNTFAAIISKDINENPMRLDEQMLDPIYAQCKIFNIIDTTITLIETAENLGDPVTIYRSPKERQLDTEGYFEEDDPYQERYIKEICDIVKKNWSR